MDAARALADLTEISSQIEAAVLLGQDGELTASTMPDEGRSRKLAEAALKLLDEAAAAGSGGGGETLSQLEVAMLDGSVFVVRSAEHSIAAATSPEPTVGLVFYDLKSCLHDLAVGEPEPEEKEPEPVKPKRKRKPGKAPAATANGDADA